jgi:hypothetical protein
MSYRTREKFGVTPGTRLDHALRAMTRPERRSTLAILSQRMPATRFNHVEVEPSDVVQIETEVAARRHLPTRRQRKWARRAMVSLNRRGVQI